MTTRIPRVLLTNDDGFDAPGLAALLDVAQAIAEEIWVVAPQLDQSGVGQSITLNNPLRCVARGDKLFAISGTPADCVIMATYHLMRDQLPTLLLSGVNAGSNVGDETNLSGTLGAAFTGLILGIPSIGISLDCESRKNLRWSTAREVLPELITGLVRAGWRQGECLSINIPDLPTDQIKGISRTRTATRNVSSFSVEQREDLREKDYFWLYPGWNGEDMDPMSDLGALSQGHISITALTLDRSVPFDE